jgi:hypothetical protein
MKVYRVRYISGVAYKGDYCTSEGEYNIWKEHIITCTSKKRVKEIVKEICPAARKITILNLGEA